MKLHGQISWIEGDGTLQSFSVKDAVFVPNEKLTIDCICSEWPYVITLNNISNDFFAGHYAKTSPTTQQRFEDRVSCKIITKINQIVITDGIWHEHGNKMRWQADLISQ